MTPQRGKALKVYTTNMLIYSRNQPEYYAYATGIKTGHTSQAGYCLVASAKKGSGSLISVMLGCEKPQGATQPVTFSETKNLFEWGFENFESKELVAEGETIEQIEVRLSTEEDKLVLVTDGSLSGTVPSDIDLTQVERTIDVPKSVDAPIKAGQKSAP